MLLTWLGALAGRYPSDFNTGLCKATLPPVGRDQFARQPSEFRSQRPLPSRRRNSENRLQAPKIEPRILRPPRLGRIVLAGDRNDALDRERNASRPETLDDRRGQSIPAGLAGRRQMHKPAGTRAALP